MSVEEDGTGKRGMWSADLDDGSIVSLGGDAGGAGHLRSVGSTSPCTLLVLCLSHCTQALLCLSLVVSPHPDHLTYKSSVTVDK